MRSSIEIANDLSVSIIDTLTATICLVDETGVIVAVNDSWCRFAEENPPIPANYGIGANYLNLKINDNILPDGDTSPADLFNFVEGIKEVLNGNQEEFTYEYPCHSPDEQRWFIGRVRRFINKGRTFLVISHENITRRVIAERQLRKSYDFLTSLIERHHAIMLLIDSETGSIIMANQSAARFYGYEVEELRNMNITQINCLDSHEIKTEMSNACKEKRNYFISPHKLKNGEIRTVEVHSTAISFEQKTLLFSIIHDITERQKAENLLLKSRREFSRLVANIPAGVYTLLSSPGGNMKFLFVSPRFSEIMQVSEEEILSDPMAAFRPIHADDLEEFKRLNLERIGKPGYFNWTGRAIINERIKWLNIASIPELDADGKTVWQGVVSDITERKLAEEKITSLLSEKEILLQEVHHRIKNNMSTIISLLAMQEDSLEDPVAKDALQDTASRIRSMLVLYQKLYESEDFNSISVKDYLSELIDDIIRHFAGQLQVSIEKNMIDFLMDIKKIQPLGIIVNEILTNIMKYAFIGRPMGNVWINLEKCDEQICLEIIDNGNGIPESVDFENSPGFGLMLIHILTQQLKGEISINRENGTKIRLKFPRNF